jgi:lysophospholipase L1-like esterase
MRLREELEERMSDSEREDLLLSWYRSEVHLGKLAYALERLAGVARTEGFEALVVILPFLERSSGWEVAYRMVEHLAAARGLEAIVLARDFPSRGLEELRHDPRDPVHPNERGHRLIGEALAPVVAAKLRALPRPGSETTAEAQALP